MPRRILVVVQVAQHRGVLEGRLQQVAELAQRAGPDGAVLVVADHRADVALVHVDIEVVQPEPGHLFLKLDGRIEVAQELARRGLAAEVVQALLVGLLRRLLHVRVGELVGGLGLGLLGDDEFGQGRVGDGQSVDLGLGQSRQGVGRSRTQLALQPGA